MYACPKTLQLGNRTFWTPGGEYIYETKIILLCFFKCNMILSKR